MAIRNGIILTGGTGSRLAPLSDIINKHLMYLGGKFVIDYPLQTLKDIGVKNLTVVLGGNHFEQIVEYLKDGSKFGFNINYIYQKEPLGIAHAVNLCKPYISDCDEFVTILGDNIYQNSFPHKKEKNKCKIILAEHDELLRFGVASVNDNKKIVKIEEKPKFINSAYKNYAITGCYFFDQKFFNYFNKIKPSARGEWEVSEIIGYYLKDNNLTYSIIDGAWIDAGTFDSINKAHKILYESNYITCRK